MKKLMNSFKEDGILSVLKMMSLKAGKNLNYCFAKAS
jgi:hypothetical protein